MSHLDNHLYSRDAKLVNFLVTSMEVARGFIALNKPRIASELLMFSTSTIMHYADKYSIKIYDEDENGNGNFTTLKRPIPVYMDTFMEIETDNKMYLDESTDVDSSGNKRIELSIVIDKSGNFA